MLPDTLAGLCLPTKGAPAARAVFAARTRATLADYLALPPTGGREPMVAAVRAAMATHPGAIAAACAAPTVGGLVGAARRARQPAERSRYVHRADALLALELGARGALAHPVYLADLGDDPLPCLAARLAFHAPSGRMWVRAEGPTDDDGGPLEAMDAAIPLRIGQLALVDSNPLLDVSAHPDRRGNPVDLGGAPTARWAEALDAALDVVCTALPEVGEELRVGLRALVPVGQFTERHDSVSFRDSVGAIYLTLHPNLLTLAEAVVHEFQHTKLHAVLRFDPLVSNAEGATYASPLRPDPRPMLGILMAVHAYVAVEALHDGLRAAGHDLAKSRDFEARAADVRRTNDDALRTVRAHARPTALGRGLVDAIDRRLTARLG